MDGSYEKKHYNSGWRPLCKENFSGSNVLVETTNKMLNQATEDSGTVQAPSPSLLNNQEELVQALAAISNEISVLDKKILDQSGKLDRILSTLDDIDRASAEKLSEDSAPASRFWGLFGNSRQ